MGYARGLTVLMMPAVHAVLVYSSPSIYNTVLVYGLRFFAEGPGAQLFMFNMGFFLALKNPRPGNGSYWRGIQLFLAGYALNGIRLYLPGKFGWLPVELLTHYTVVPSADIHLPLLLSGDILQFAGIGYAVMSWIHRHIKGSVFPILLYGMIALLAPFCRGIHSNWLGLDYALGLFFAEDARAFFPVFSWLCYPLAGYVAGNLFQQLREEDFYKRILQAGLLLLAAGILIKQLGPAGWELDFYRTGPGTTLAYTGFQLIWICFLQICLNYLPGVRPWKQLLLFCSRHITSIYIIHWILIGWSIGLIGYHTLALVPSCFALSIMSILTFLATYLIHWVRNKRFRYHLR